MSYFFRPRFTCTVDIINFISTWSYDKICTKWSINNNDLVKKILERNTFYFYQGLFCTRVVFQRLIYKEISFFHNTSIIIFSVLSSFDESLWHSSRPESIRPLFVCSDAHTPRRQMYAEFNCSHWCIMHNILWYQGETDHGDNSCERTV